MLYYASMYVPQMACFCVFFIFVPFIQLCWLQWITWTWILALFFWKKTFFLGLNRWSMIHKIKSLIWARLISPFFNTSFELNFKVLNLLKKLGRMWTEIPKWQQTCYLCLIYQQIKATLMFHLSSNAIIFSTEH